MASAMLRLYYYRYLYAFEVQYQSSWQAQHSSHYVPVQSSRAPPEPLLQIIDTEPPPTSSVKSLQAQKLSAFPVLEDESGRCTWQFVYACLLRQSDKLQLRAMMDRLLRDSQLFVTHP